MGLGLRTEDSTKEISKSGQINEPTCGAEAAGRRTAKEHPPVKIYHLIRQATVGVTFLCLPFRPIAHASPQSTGMKVTLCVLASNPEKYDNRYVTITAYYESDGVEREGLSDPSCNEAGLELLLSHRRKGQGQLQDALRGGHPGTLDNVIMGLSRASSNGDHKSIHRERYKCFR
jgi:hypothetical protein